MKEIATESMTRGIKMPRGLTQSEMEEELSDGGRCWEDQREFYLHSDHTFVHEFFLLNIIERFRIQCLKAMNSKDK